MKKLAALLVVVALIGIVWLQWRPGPAGDEAGEEPATDVAVRVGAVTRTTMRAQVTAYGVVRPQPAGERPAASASVAPSVAGVVVAVERTEGQRVSTGDVLFRLDSRAADVAVALAETAVERERRLIRIEGTSQQALDNAEYQLEAARVAQALLQVRSPLDGTITRIAVNPGEAVDLATVMAEIVDFDRLVVSAGVPSAELAEIEAGQTAEVVIGDGAPVEGTVTFVGARVDPRTGTAEIRVELPTGSGLRPGEFVMVRITSAEHPDTLTVPLASVVRNEDGASVIAIVDGGTARQRRVETGLRDGARIEVEADGLQPGMIVVTEGAYGLPAETRVHIIDD
jgi:membrane fusion protein, multidrug efflux system